MEYKQLGNGGGLSPEMTNSSFLIRQNDDYLLFDVGYNIMAKLRKDKSLKKYNKIINRINTVFISHLHEDHICNLSTLLAYRKLVLGNKTTYVVCDKEILENVKQYVSLTGNEEWGTFVDTVEYNKKYSNEFSLISIKGNHGKQNKQSSFGALIFDKKANHMFISGDTIADLNIETQIRLVLPSDLIDELVIFHDLTFAPESGTHATIDDIKDTYSEPFLNGIQYYHTRYIDFVSKWTEVKNNRKYLKIGF
jgi:ribonuclease BN (tRNA processing enzyme)